VLEISNVGILTALAAGAISFLSPCVLPLVPGYISYVAGNSAATGEMSRSAGRRLSALLLSSFFVMGFSTVFIALGASAMGISRLLLWYRYEANIVGGGIIILFGIFMTGSYGCRGFSAIFAFTALCAAVGRSAPMSWGWPSGSAGRPASAPSLAQY